MQFKVTVLAERTFSAGSVQEARKIISNVGQDWNQLDSKLMRFESGKGWVN